MQAFDSGQPPSTCSALYKAIDISISLSAHEVILEFWLQFWEWQDLMSLIAMI